MKSKIKILAIDTSLDETSVAVTRNEWVLSNVISSQVDLHRKWGGVVPTIAKRAHEENIDQAVQESLLRARTKLSQLDFIAVTQGPGQPIALEVGIKKAKELSERIGKPLIPINHMEGHLLSCLAKNSKGKQGINFSPKLFPALGLLVSGGHTEIILVNEIGSYQKVGQTVDDAAGEAFDKFGRMVGLGYPSGEVIEQFAKQGDRLKYDFPRPMSNSGDLNYSFSGLKTAALYLTRELQGKKLYGEKNRMEEINLSKRQIVDLCASYQYAVIDSLMIKLNKALKQYSVKSVFCGGGVMANVSLRRAISHVCRESSVIPCFPYNKKMYTDNAAMIGVTAYFQIANSNDTLNLTNFDREPNLAF